MKNRIKKRESGLTLVEMLTAVSVLVIIGGTTYAVFRSAIDAYQRTQSKLIRAQRCRVALDWIATDLSQMQADAADPMLALYSEDRQSASGDADILSIVTLVKTEPDPFFVQQNPASAAAPLLSDVRRVAYFVAPAMSIEESQSGAGLPSPYTTEPQGGRNTDTEPESLSLYRVITTALDPELFVSYLSGNSTLPTEDENGVPIYTEVTPLIDGILNFDLKYTDDETVYESWMETESFPLTVQILISVSGDEDGAQPTTGVVPSTPSQEETFVPPNALTQSTMVYLPASATANDSGGGGAQQ